MPCGRSQGASGTKSHVLLFAVMYDPTRSLRCLAHPVKAMAGVLLRRVAVVGNAPVSRCQAAAIDAHDDVVRCNKAVGFGGARGSRCDHLVLINCGGQMAEWLQTGAIERSPAFAAATTVWLPIHPGKAALIEPPLSPSEWQGALAQDHTEAASERFRSHGKTVRLFDAPFFTASLAALGHPMRRNAPAPSTGYLAVRWWLERLGNVRVSAFGFGFAGWDGHDFSAERAWFAAREREGVLTVVDPDRTHPPASAVSSPHSSHPETLNSYG